MRAASASMIAFLNGNTVGTMRHIVTVTPRSGSVVRWTDHARDITYGGNTYSAGGDGTTHPVVIVGGFETKIGLDASSLRMMLLCGDGDALFNGTYLPAAALNGTLDGAWVKVERMFGADEIDTSLGTVNVCEGPVGMATPSDHTVELEIESGTALLRTQLPKVIFQPGCTNRLYDGQCGLNVAAFTVSGTVDSGATTTSIPSDRTEATGTTNSQGYFALGVITFLTGTCAGESRSIRSYSNTGGTFVVDRPLPFAPDSGDTFEAYPGCPKTIAACDNASAAAGPAFDNLDRFRGFPFVPKNEAGG